MMDVEIGDRRPRETRKNHLVPKIQNQYLSEVNDSWKLKNEFGGSVYIHAVCLYFLSCSKNCIIYKKR
jgi:hypothetical protein